MAAEPIVWLKHRIRVMLLDKEDEKLFREMYTACCAVQYDAYLNRSNVEVCNQGII